LLDIKEKEKENEKLKNEKGNLKNIKTKVENAIKINFK